MNKMAKPVDLNPDKDVAILIGEKMDLGKQKAYGKKQVELDTQKVILDKWTLFNDKY